MSSWKAFEREAARRIGIWWCDDDTAFRRSPCSGGWPKKRADGDIIAINDRMRLEHPIVYDCKHRKGSTKFPWHLEQLLTHKNHLLVQWWHEMGEMEPVKKGRYRWLIVSKSGISESLLVLGLREVRAIEAIVPDKFRAIPKISFAVGRCEDPSVETEVLTFCRFLEFMDTIDGSDLRGKLVWET